ncbi:hypothetical protein Prudu_018510 [Prunus dulcis]|uniref:F-box domain-containing protein n=1 Tax=Prunus dulcis TaxID=3755 RepID=A0A4Y1RQY2_PRUDU|nr:hypothetical protein Prudu_018510 [Prunus dulcis]
MTAQADQEKGKVEASPDPVKVMEEVKMDRKPRKEEKEEEVEVEVRMGCYNYNLAKRRKTKGEGHNFVLADRISELPDEILVSILSLLSLKEAATTSILSKRWQHLWASTMTLNFDAKLDLGSSNLRHFRGLQPEIRYQESHRYINWIRDANLVSFVYNGGFVNLDINNVPLLIEVSIFETDDDFELDTDIIKIVLGQLSCVVSQLEILRLDIDQPCYHMFKSKIYDKKYEFPVFANLKHLELIVESDYRWLLHQLNSFIKASPYLQRLALKLQFQTWKCDRKLKKAAICPHHYLKVVEIVGYRARRLAVTQLAEGQAFFVFGDSLVDRGNNNNNYLITFARADSYPYGIDSPTRRATCRFPLFCSACSALLSAC